MVPACCSHIFILISFPCFLPPLFSHKDTHKALIHTECGYAPTSVATIIIYDSIYTGSTWQSRAAVNGQRSAKVRFDPISAGRRLCAGVNLQFTKGRLLFVEIPAMLISI